MEEELQWEEYRSNGLFDPDSLDGITLPVKEKSISAVIITYNRSPYSPKTPDFKKNPLLWYTNSLLRQRGNVLREIIFVNDGSTDYTSDTIKSLEDKIQERGIGVKVIEHDTNLGQPQSRTDGLDNVDSEYVFYGDDDCLLSEHSLSGALYSLEEIASEGVNIAAIHLPTFYRDTMPPEFKSCSELMQLNLDEGVIRSDLKNFPREYLNGNNDKFLNRELKIFRPIESTNLAGVFLGKKDAIEEVGGFPLYFTWDNGYSEETEMALNLMEAGYKLFLTPDPKFGVVHLRAGDGSEADFSKIREKDLARHYGNGLNLKEMIEESSIPRLDTGNRIDADEYLYSKIISWFVLILKRNENGGIYWAKETYKDFVIDNTFNLYGAEIQDRGDREKIWRAAMEDGVSLVNSLNGKNYSHVLDKI